MARIALTEGSRPWPCDLSAAVGVRLNVAPARATVGTGSVRLANAGSDGTWIKPSNPNIRIAAAEFEPSQMQDLGDLIPAILDLKARAKVPIRFHVRIEVGGSDVPPPPAVLEELNRTLQSLGEGFRIE